MPAAILSTFSFLGLVYGAHSILKIRLSYSPLFCISFLGISLFLFAVADCLKGGAQLLLCIGGIFCLLFLIRLIRRQKALPKPAVHESFDRSIWILVALFVIALLLSIGSSFTVIDDYVYWGIIGKYIALHDHLPIQGNPLDKRILAYTPGTGLIHYFFCLLNGGYSRDLSYFAQNVILVSALFTVVKQDCLKESIARIGILILLITLFCGSVFNKLQVDPLLSLISFAIFWIYVNETGVYKKLFIISMPVCFLFLIKQIGFGLGIAALVMVALDLAIRTSETKCQKVVSFLILMAVFAGVITLKEIWTYRIHIMGFAELHDPINFSAVKQALNIFTNEYARKGSVIFIKEVFLGQADRLNLPYLVWYGVVFLLGYKILKTLTKENRKQLYAFCLMLSLTLLFYLLSLYFFQIIVFNVGHLHQHTIGFTRYFNIFFLPVIMILVMSAIHVLWFMHRKINISACVTLSVLVMIVLFASKWEVSLHREKLDIEVEKVAMKIQNHIPRSALSVGILTSQKEKLANLQLLYYLLPNKVDYRAGEFNSNAQMIQYINQHDYVIIFYPGLNMGEWIGHLIQKNKQYPDVGLLKVKKTDSASIEPQASYELVPI